MDIGKILKSINELKQIATIGVMPNRADSPHKWFGASPETIVVFQGAERVGKFEQIIAEI
jgi:hypothetical protein